MPTDRLVPALNKASVQQGGFALVIVLWMMALFAVLAGAFSVSTRTEAKTTLNIAEHTKARFLADAAVQHGIFELLNRHHEKAWKADGTEYSVTFGEAELMVSLMHERGKVDLNYAPEDLLRGLLISAGAASDSADALVDAIADWRDEDELTRLRGAEAADYRQAGLSIVPENAPFRTSAELQQVLGMTAELYRKIEPLVTVHSFTPTIDPNAAPRGVLLALPGVNAEEVEEFLSVREEERYERDDVLLPPLASAGPWLAAGDGSVFTVRGSAMLASGARVVRDAIVWVVEPGSPDYWILDSRDGSVWQNAAEAGQ